MLSHGYYEKIKLNTTTDSQYKSRVQEYAAISPLEVPRLMLLLTLSFTSPSSFLCLPEAPNDEGGPITFPITTLTEVWGALSERVNYWRCGMEPSLFINYSWIIGREASSGESQPASLTPNLTRIITQRGSSVSTRVQKREEKVLLHDAHRRQQDLNWPLESCTSYYYLSKSGSVVNVDVYSGRDVTFLQ